MGYGMGTVVKTELQRYMDLVADERRIQGEQHKEDNCGDDFGSFTIVEFYHSYIEAEVGEIASNGKAMKRGKSVTIGELLIGAASEKIKLLMDKMAEELAAL